MGAKDPVLPLLVTVLLLASAAGQPFYFRPPNLQVPAEATCPTGGSGLACGFCQNAFSTPHNMHCGGTTLPSTALPTGGLEDATPLCQQQCAANAACNYFEIRGFSLATTSWTCLLYTSCTCLIDANNRFFFKYAKTACPTSAAQAGCGATQFWNPAACSGTNNGCTECTLCASGFGYNGAGGRACSATENGICGHCGALGLQRSGAGYVCQAMTCAPVQTSPSPSMLALGADCNRILTFGETCSAWCKVGSKPLNSNALYANCTFNTDPQSAFTAPARTETTFGCVGVNPCLLSTQMSIPGMTRGTCPLVGAGGVPAVVADTACTLACGVDYLPAGNMTVHCIHTPSSLDGQFARQPTANCIAAGINACMNVQPVCDPERSDCVYGGGENLYSCRCKPGYESRGDKLCVKSVSISIPAPSPLPDSLCSMFYLDHTRRSIRLCNGVGQTGYQLQMSEAFKGGVNTVDDLRFRNGSQGVTLVNVIKTRTDPGPALPQPQGFPAGEYVLIELCDPSFVTTEQYGLIIFDTVVRGPNVTETTYDCARRLDYRGMPPAEIDFYSYAPTSPYVVDFFDATGTDPVTGASFPTKCWRAPLCFADDNSTYTTSSPGSYQPLQPRDLTPLAFGPLLQSAASECLTTTYCPKEIKPIDGCLEPQKGVWGDVQCICNDVHEASGPKTCELKRCHAPPRDGVGSLGVALPCRPYLGGVKSGESCQALCDKGFEPSGDKYLCTKGTWKVVFQEWEDPEPPPDVGNTARVGCVDIDECARENAHLFGDNDGLACSRRAVCTNLPGSYSCRCLKGFFGDGRFCEDVNECAVNHGGCHAAGTCVNMIGSFSCGCPQGYVGDGVLCNDVNECAVDPQSCAVHARCFNTLGGFTCQCNPGFLGDPFTVCEPINHCLVNVTAGLVGCDTHAHCAEQRTCVCNEGYLGQGYLGQCFTCGECDDGLYLVKGCTATSDRQCAECSPPCGPGFFEVPCGAAADRVCFEDDGIFEFHNPSGLVPFTLPRLQVAVRYGKAIHRDPLNPQKTTPTYVRAAPGSVLPNNITDMLFVAAWDPFVIRRHDVTTAAINGRFGKGEYLEVAVTGLPAGADVHLVYYVSGIFVDAEDMCADINPDWNVPAPPPPPGASLLASTETTQSTDGSTDTVTEQDYLWTHAPQAGPSFASFHPGAAPVNAPLARRLRRRAQTHTQAQAHTLSALQQAGETPITTAYALLELEARGTVLAAGRDKQAHQRAQRLDRQVQQQLAGAVATADQAQAQAQPSERVFRVCYTRDVTQFLFVVPVPEVQPFTCADRLYDYPQFFAALNVGPRLIQCPADCRLFKGAIYGKENYTLDSVACTAASHATTQNGGIFEVTLKHLDAKSYPADSAPVALLSTPTQVLDDSIQSKSYPHPYPTAFSMRWVRAAPSRPVS